MIEDFTYLVNSARTLRRSKKVDPLLKGADSKGEGSKQPKHHAGLEKAYFQDIFGSPLV